MASAKAALEVLDSAGVDVLVSDLGLPEMSGHELMKRVIVRCEAAQRRPPPSCAVSAHVREIDRWGAIDAGFDRYLAKPILPETLIEAVAELAGPSAST